MTDPHIRSTDERAKRQGQLTGGDNIQPIRADNHSDARPATQTPIQGRQGFLGRPVLAVLGGGLTLAVFAWLVVHYTVP